MALIIQETRKLKELADQLDVVARAIQTTQSADIVLHDGFVGGKNIGNPELNSSVSGAMQSAAMDILYEEFVSIMNHIEATGLKFEDRQEFITSAIGKYYGE